MRNILLIKTIKDTMLDWYSFELTEEQVNEYLNENVIDGFDTVERECYLDYLAQKLTGMSWPMYGDSEEYKTNFYKQLVIKSKEFGYIWNE